MADYPEGIKPVSLSDEAPHAGFKEFWAPVFLFRDPGTGKVWKWGGNFAQGRIETAELLDSSIRVYGDGVEFLMAPDRGYRRVTIDEAFEGKFGNAPGWMPVEVGDVAEHVTPRYTNVFWANRGDPIGGGMVYDSVGTCTLKRGDLTLEGLGTFQHFWGNATRTFPFQNGFHIFTDWAYFRLLHIKALGFEWKDGCVIFQDGSYDVLGKTVDGYPYKVVDGPRRLSYDISIETSVGLADIEITEPLHGEPPGGFQQEYWSQVTVNGSQLGDRGMAASETIRPSKMSLLVPGLAIAGVGIAYVGLRKR